MPHLAGTALRDITPREVERLTGVGGERLRTWRRRFQFPDGGSEGPRGRGFSERDLPGILAVREMIEAGFSVGDAINFVRNDAPEHADLSGLAQAFSRLDTPVVVISGPEPLQVAWSNPAALREADGADLLPPRGHALYRTVQRALVDPGGRALAMRPPRTGTGEGAGHRALVWRLGAPAFTPSVVVVLDLPGEVPDLEPAVRAADPDELTLRAITRGVHDGRKLLQRGIGGPLLSDALAALAEGAGAHDAWVLLAEGQELRGGMSAHGRLLSAVAGKHVDGAWRDARASGSGARWLGGGALVELGAERPCLALSLAGGGRELGLLVVEYDEQFELAELAGELLLGFGTALAGAILRDRAAALRRAQLAA